MQATATTHIKSVASMIRNLAVTVPFVVLERSFVHVTTRRHFFSCAFSLVTAPLTLVRRPVVVGLLAVAFSLVANPRAFKDIVVLANRQLSLTLSPVMHPVALRAINWCSTRTIKSHGDTKQRAAFTHTHT
jgi:hypothetical protein